MKIIMKSGELKAADVYNLTKSPEINKMQDAVGMVLGLKAYVVYEDVNQKGETNTITSIMHTDGTCFASNSPTFNRDFLDMLELFDQMGEKVNSILVVQKTSKNNRPFITAVYND